MTRMFARHATCLKKTDTARRRWNNDPASYPEIWPKNQP